VQEIRLERVEFASVAVSDRTEWTFAEVSDSGGRTAVTEITCGNETPGVIAAIVEFLAVLRGREISEESHLTEMLGLTVDRIRADRPLATAISAIRTAIVDIQSQHSNMSITEALGGPAQESVELYANINRSLGPSRRSPADFAEAAERAVADGFATVKCAPFDDVVPPAGVDEVRRLARPGLERVAAVRAAIGRDVRVLVDCHSRFDALSAPWVAQELAKSDIGWFEEPVQPTRDADALSEIAEQVSMPVAGGETGYGTDFFAELVKRSAVEVIMPDIKYCGGVAEALSAGRAAQAAGGRASLHSPSGPISQLASAHVTAAMPGAMALEHAVGEAAWRAELLVPPERIENGRLWFPGGPGLGATLNPDMVTRHSPG
jgi:galactonate dehydratase